MADKDFGKGIKAVQQRVKALREQASHVSPEEDIALSEAIEQLQTALEELMVAEEELRQQNEELAAARNELENQKNRYQDLFDFAPDAYIVTDREGTIREANRASSLTFNVPAQFLVGKPLPAFVAEENRKIFRSGLNKLSTLDYTCEMELRMCPRDSKPFDASLKVVPIRDNKGETIGLRWLIRDITERKKEEKSIRALNDELEARVLERTAEIEFANRAKEELLAQAQKAQREAESANRSKDEFLALISHEIRTPLNAVIGWVQILRKKQNNPEMVARAGEIIERNAQAQAQIINDLLEISSMIAGKLRLEFKCINLASVIQSALDAVQPSAEAKKINLQVESDQEVGPVSGDPNRLQQVVWNLLANSIKFTPEGGSVEVALRQTESHACITVTDMGKGISPDFLPYIFDRFRQADATPRRKYGGLGIGLAIVRYLVEMHGGAVSAASAGEGKGTTFTVTLPLAGDASASEVSAEVNAPAQPSLNPDDRPFKGLKVLVVDDESDARQFLKMDLEHLGAKVAPAGSCSEALAMLNPPDTSDRPDILIADLAMPGEDGFDLIRKVRLQDKEREARLPAIAVTAYAGAKENKRALAQGFDLHISKPVSLRELIAAIARLTGRA
ncbi:MAG TPA: ATP-binding protein [Blastocatellia bacterium]|jgi:PAS domain S-box-containing protein